MAFHYALGVELWNPFRSSGAELASKTVSCCDRPPAPATADEDRQHARAMGVKASDQDKEKIKARTFRRL
jgi:hypothetical protein